MYVLLGSNGQITSQLARALRSGGHAVRVVGRNARALEPLAAAGVQVAAGDPGDEGFLRRAFAGASGVYTMIPPCFAEADMGAAQDRIGTAISQALRATRVPRVVNLSSIGAELASGTGPIEGLHVQEQRLDAIDGIDLLHLRPGWFMENLFAALAPIAQAGVLPGMEAPEATIPMVATRDIAAVAARELVTPGQRGTLLLHAPRHATQREVAEAIGAAIGQPQLPYVQIDPSEARTAMLAHGFSDSACDRLTALARWLSTSPLASAGAGSVEVQPTTLQAFAREVFAPAHAAFASARSPDTADGPDARLAARI
jgi:uncharacterized protein YbjT (DUF2867 family)